MMKRRSAENPLLKNLRNQLFLLATDESMLLMNSSYFFFTLLLYYFHSFYFLNSYHLYYPSKKTQAIMDKYRNKDRNAGHSSNYPPPSPRKKSGCCSVCLLPSFLSVLLSQHPGSPSNLCCEVIVLTSFILLSQEYFWIIVNQISVRLYIIIVDRRFQSVNVNCLLPVWIDDSIYLTAVSSSIPYVF